MLLLLLLHRKRHTLWWIACVMVLARFIVFACVIMLSWKLVANIYCQSIIFNNCQFSCHLKFLLFESFMGDANWCWLILFDVGWPSQSTWKCQRMPPVAPPPPPRTNLPSHDKNIHLAKFLHCSGVCVILFCEDFLPHIFSLQGRLCLNCCLKDRSLFQLATYSAFVDFQDFLNKGYYNALQWTAFWHKNLHNVFNTIWEHLLLTHQGLGRLSTVCGKPTKHSINIQKPIDYQQNFLSID